MRPLGIVLAVLIDLSASGCGRGTARPTTDGSADRNGGAGAPGSGGTNGGTGGTVGATGGTVGGTGGTAGGTGGTAGGTGGTVGGTGGTAGGTGGTAGGTGGTVGGTGGTAGSTGGTVAGTGGGAGTGGAGTAGAAVDAAADTLKDAGTADALGPLVLTQLPSGTTANLTAVLVTADRLYVATEAKELRSRAAGVWTPETLPADLMGPWITDLAMTSDGRLVIATIVQIWTRGPAGWKLENQSSTCSGFSEKRLTTGPDGTIYSGCPFVQISRDGTTVGDIGMGPVVYLPGGSEPALYGLKNPSPFSPDHIIFRNATALPFQTQASWIMETLPAATPDAGASRTPYVALTALADGTVIAVGDGAGGLIAARRAGAWRLEFEGGPALRDVWGSGATAVAVGDAGTVVVNDGGAWTKRTSPSTASLTAVHGLDASNIVAVGNNGTIVEGRR